MGKNNLEVTIDDIKGDILLSILKKVNPPIGAKHIPCDKFVNNIPRRLRGLAKKALDELINEDEFILKRPSQKGYTKCSLNYKKIQEMLLLPKIIETVKEDEWLRNHLEQKYHHKFEINE